jgi:hypothetical protein
LLLVSSGFLSSHYIKEREYNAFVNKYEEKGILIIPVAFKPCDIQSWESLSRFQFFKPRGIDYGEPAIDDFTFADLVKFNRADGLPIPNPNIDRYISNLVNKIESAYQYFSENKKKHPPEIAGIIQNNNDFPNQKNRLNGHPIPGVLFTGRAEQITEFVQLFKSYRLLTVEGLGGTGKTQFVAKCIQELLLDKSKIIWLDGSAQSNFDIFVERAGYGDVLKGKEKTDLDSFSGLKDLIEKDGAIIFWDNYNDYEDPSFNSFLSFSYKYLQKATVVIITKTEPSIIGITSIPTIKLDGLDKDAIEYAKKFRSSDARYASISDMDLDLICEGVDGHPLAIELSMYLMGYGKSAKDILTHMPEFSSVKKVEEFSKRLFLDIF